MFVCTPKKKSVPFLFLLRALSSFCLCNERDDNIVSIRLYLSNALHFGTLPYGTEEAFLKGKHMLLVHRPE